MIPQENPILFHKRQNRPARNPITYEFNIMSYFRVIGYLSRSYEVANSRHFAGKTGANITNNSANNFKAQQKIP